MGFDITLPFASLTRKMETSIRDSLHDKSNLVETQYASVDAKIPQEADHPLIVEVREQYPRYVADTMPCIVNETRSTLTVKL